MKVYRPPKNSAKRILTPREMIWKISNGPKSGCLGLRVEMHCDEKNLRFIKLAKSFSPTVGHPHPFFKVLYMSCKTRTMLLSEARWIMCSVIMAGQLRNFTLIIPVFLAMLSVGIVKMSFVCCSWVYKGVVLFSFISS